MTVTVDDFVQELRLYTPDVVDQVIQRALLETAGEFCRQTGVWRDALELDPAVPGASEVAYSASARVVGLVHVIVNRHELTLKGDELLRTPPARQPVKAVFLGPEALHFDGVLDGQEDIEARAILEPRLTATTLPDVLGHDWGYALRAGTLSKLLRVPSCDTYNERLAIMHEGRFNDFIRSARGRSRSGWTHTPRTVKYGGI